MSAPGAFADLQISSDRAHVSSCAIVASGEPKPVDHRHAAALRAGLDFVLGRNVAPSDLIWLKALISTVDAEAASASTASFVKHDALSSAILFLQAEIMSPDFWERWGADLNESSRKNLSEGLGLPTIVVPIKFG